MVAVNHHHHGHHLPTSSGHNNPVDKMKRGLNLMNMRQKMLILALVSVFAQYLSVVLQYYYLSGAPCPPEGSLNMAENNNIVQTQVDNSKAVAAAAALPEEVKQQENIVDNNNHPPPLRLQINKKKHNNNNKPTQQEDSDSNEHPSGQQQKQDDEFFKDKEKKNSRSNNNNNNKGKETTKKPPTPQEEQFMRNLNRHKNKMNYTHDDVNVDSQYCDPLPIPKGNVEWDYDAKDPVRTNRMYSHGLPVRKHTDRRTICGPKVMIIGSMKCGTNTAAILLEKHPRVKVNMCDNRRWWLCNETYFQGNSWEHEIWEGHHFSFFKKFHSDWLEEFAERLPWTDGRTSISFDKSPSYISTEDFIGIANLTRTYLPKAKIVLSTCNPSLRLYSEFQHQLERTKDNFDIHFKMFNITPPEKFGKFVDLVVTRCKDEAASRSDYCLHQRKMWLGKAEYAARLLPWIEAYGMENVAVLDMEESEEETVERLLKLVGEDILPYNEYPWHELKEGGTIIDFKNPRYTGRSTAYRDYPLEIGILDEFYKAQNVELAKTFNVTYPLRWIEEGQRMRNISASQRTS
jgi:hypothetical protein